MTLDIVDNSLQTGGRTLQEADDVIAAGHPPIAEGVVLVDFDGTIAPFGFLFDYPKPLPGVVDFMQKLAKADYRAVIFTSRLSTKWLKSVGQTKQQHIEYITSYCQKYNIPFNAITAEKIPCVAYYDDKAVRVTNNWLNLRHAKYGVNL